MAQVETGWKVWHACHSCRDRASAVYDVRGLIHVRGLNPLVKNCPVFKAANAVVSGLAGSVDYHKIASNSQLRGSSRCC